MLPVRLTDKCDPAILSAVPELLCPVRNMNTLVPNSQFLAIVAIIASMITITIIGDGTAIGPALHVVHISPLHHDPSYLAKPQIAPPYGLIAQSPSTPLSIHTIGNATNEIDIAPLSYHATAIALARAQPSSTAADGPPTYTNPATTRATGAIADDPAIDRATADAHNPNPKKKRKRDANNHAKRQREKAQRQRRNALLNNNPDPNPARALDDAGQSTPTPPNLQSTNAPARGDNAKGSDGPRDPGTSQEGTRARGRAHAPDRDNARGNAHGNAGNAHGNAGKSTPPPPHLQSTNAPARGHTHSHTNAKGSNGPRDPGTSQEGTRARGRTHTPHHDDASGNAHGNAGKSTPPPPHLQSTNAPARGDTHSHTNAKGSDGPRDPGTSQEGTRACGRTHAPDAKGSDGPRDPGTSQEGTRARGRSHVPDHDVRESEIWSMLRSNADTILHLRQLLGLSATDIPQRVRPLLLLPPTTGPTHTTNQTPNQEDTQTNVLNGPSNKLRRNASLKAALRTDRMRPDDPTFATTARAANHVSHIDTHGYSKLEITYTIDSVIAYFADHPDSIPLSGLTIVHGTGLHSTTPYDPPSAQWIKEHLSTLPSQPTYDLIWFPRPLHVVAHGGRFLPAVRHLPGSRRSPAVRPVGLPSRPRALAALRPRGVDSCAHCCSLAERRSRSTSDCH